MEDKIQKLYIEVLEKIAINTVDCKMYIKSSDTSSLMDYIDQRTALINILRTLKVKISNDYPLSEEFEKTSNLFISKMESFNQEILIYLKLEKEKTKLQIAKTHKNKENLKGYNLKSIK